jgi:hypothetical protein
MHLLCPALLKREPRFTQIHVLFPKFSCRETDAGLPKGVSAGLINGRVDFVLLRRATGRGEMLTVVAVVVRRGNDGLVVGTVLDMKVVHSELNLGLLGSGGRWAEEGSACALSRRGRCRP